MIAPTVVGSSFALGFRSRELRQLGNGNDDANCQLKADYGRISSAPNSGTTAGTGEIWTLSGAAWDHPVHIHFEEGQIIGRTSSGAGILVPP